MDAPQYVLSGKIIHPEGVNIELEKIKDDEENKQVIVAYQAVNDPKNSSDCFVIEQPFTRPEWAARVLVTLKNKEGRYEDPEAYIFE